MSVLQHLRPAIVMTTLFVLVTGLAYPLAITGLAQIVLPYQANGSLIRDGAGVVRGSALIAQGFAGPGYLHTRPSAAGTGYDASNSSGSNLGPMDPKLAARVKTDAAKIEGQAPGAAIPADAVTTSGSGLDPEVSPENAAMQAPRIAAARGMTADGVRTLLAQFTEQPILGFIGQPRVNVLRVNEALDRAHPLGSPKA